MREGKERFEGSKDNFSNPEYLIRNDVETLAEMLLLDRNEIRSIFRPFEIFNFSKRRSNKYCKNEVEVKWRMQDKCAASKLNSNFHLIQDIIYIIWM